jgi:hypothetical protein
VYISAVGRARSIILTSNKSYGDWGSIFGDQIIATAILDRLLHHSTTINIRGESYRLKDRRRAGLLPRPESAATVGANPRDSGARFEHSRQTEPFRMSVLRHRQIYRPMLPFSKREGFATLPLSSSDESATGYSLASCTPALLASPSPATAHREAHSWKPLATTRSGLRNFHPAKWGFFSRR